MNQDSNNYDTISNANISMDYANTPRLDDTGAFGPDAVRDFYIVLVVGLLSLQLNLFGSLYIICRAYLQWNRGGRSSIPLSLRFPVYIALTDGLLALGYTVNLSYTLVTKHTWSNPACQIIGTFAVTVFILNMLVVGIVALTTWCYVCKERYIEFGAFDYKLWTVTLALSIAIFFVTLRNSGQQKYWCAGRFHDSVVPIVMIVLISMILLTVLVCYIKILLKIRNNEDSLFATRHRQARVEKRALRKLISYIFIFLLQFIPLLAYNFFSLIMIENVLLHVLAITTINFGGIGNFIQFVINEGLKLSTQSNSQLSSAIKEVKEQNHPTDSAISQPEIKDDIEIKTNDNDIVETIPDITYSNSIENGDKMNSNLGNDDGALDDHLSAFDTTITVTANSSDVLLNQDEDFLHELNQYTKM